MKKIITRLLLLLFIGLGRETDAQCVFNPSNITVSGFGCFGPNGVYTPNGTFNGAPKWDSPYGPGAYRIVWSSGRWEIQSTQGVPFPVAANSTGSITNLPCSGGWTDPDDVGCIATVVTLSGGCGSLLPQTVAPAVTVTANPGNSISAGTSVTFTATPVNGGAMPAYQWKKNGNNVGTNSNTYTDTGLIDGDIITCTLTSSDPCALPATATSNGITMHVICYQDIIVTGNDFDLAGTYTYLDQFNGAPRWSLNGTNTIYWDAAASVWFIEYPDDPLFGGGYGIYNETGSISMLPCTGWSGLNFSGGCGPLPVAGVSATADPGNTISEGTSVTFTATPVNGGATPTYQWKKNGNDVGLNSNTYTDAALVDGDIITVVMTSSAPCTAPVTSTAITMTVTDPCVNVNGRIYVKPGGTGNGSSWAQATSDLQAAIDNTCGAIEVWVASGTYKPAHYPTGCTGCSEPRDFAFMLKNGVKVYGGFAGTETTLSERVSGNASVLSGDIDNNDATDIGNVRHVVISVNDDATTLLDGFVVTKGYAENTNTQTEAPITVETAQLYRSYAGGILLFSSAMKLHNVTFSDNYAFFGGGALLQSCNNLSFNNCQFLNNKTNSGYGTGICDYYSINTEIDSCTFSGNTGLSGGYGTFYFNGQSCAVKHSRFASNTALYGGGIYVSTYGISIVACVFEMNSAEKGGGVYSYQDGTISNSLFVGNNASSNESFGGGGAIYHRSYDLNVFNCTIANNHATNGKGGGISSYYGDIVIKNSILWGNTQTVSGTQTSQISTDIGHPALNMAHSIIQDGVPTSVTDEGGNHFTDPLFVNAASGNFSLMGCSPAINTGNNTAATGTDIAGAVRIQQGIVDIGAYEVTPGIGFITSIALSNLSAPECHNTSCTEDDEFTADITVNFLSKPLSGTLQLSGASLYNAGSVPPVAVASLGATSYTFTGVALHADGADYALTATFSEGCSRVFESATKAPTCGGSDNIVVSGFTSPGDNGTYVPDGTYNNAPRWSNGVCELIFGGGVWTFKRLGALPFTMSNNYTGTALQVPCSNWYSFGNGTPVLDGACDGHSTAPACVISNIGLSNISSCNGNNSSVETDDFFTADVEVTFGFAPAGKTLVLKKGSTTLAFTQSNLACATSFIFEDVQLPANGQALVLSAEFIGLDNGATCSFTSGTLTTAPAPCSGSPISGRVIWEHLHFTANPIPVPDVTITMTGESSDNDQTTALGTYLLSGSGDVFVTPSKNDNPRQGVDAADVTRIRQHALGTLLFNDGYKVLAADVNENNSVTSADATIVQQALLGTPFPASLLDNPSWRFVVVGFDFSQPNAPWIFPSAQNVIDVNAPVTGIDFIGVKMGDVTGTWNSGVPLMASPVALLVANNTLETGTVHRASFVFSQNRPDVAAMQFMLRFDPDYVKINSVIPQTALPLTREDFGMNHIEEGELRSVFAVASGQSVKAGEVVFDVELEVLQGGVLLSDVVSLDNSSTLPARIYDTNLSGGQLQLAFTPSREKWVLPVSAVRNEEVFELFQNIPNPMNDETVIGFTLPAESSAMLTIHDADGKMLTQIKGDYFAGFNTITIPRHLLGRSAGVLSYTLTAGNYSATRRLVILDK